MARIVAETEALGEVLHETKNPLAKEVHEASGEFIAINRLVILTNDTFATAQQTLEKQTRVQEKSDWGFVDPQALKNSVSAILTRVADFQAPLIQAIVERYNFELNPITSRAFDLARGLMDLFYGKAVYAYGTGAFSGTTKFDLTAKVSQVYSNLITCKNLSTQLHESALRVPFREFSP